VTGDPRRTPSASGEYPLRDRAICPDLSEHHPRSTQQVQALAAVNGFRHDRDGTYDGPRVAALAQIHCSQRLHLPGMSPEIGLVVWIGDELVYFASIPDVHVTIPPIEQRRPDFRSVELEQWIWGLGWPEVDRLRAHCPFHHDVALWLDRRLIWNEIAHSAPPRHGDMLSLQLERVAITSS
jgi:hypothetical protein